MTIFFYVSMIVFFLIAGFLFAGSEMALISLNRHRGLKRSEAGDGQCRSLMKILDDPTRMINTLLIGINLCIVSDSILVHAFLEKLHVMNPAFWTLLFMSFAYLIIGELIPKMLFHLAPNKMALLILPFLKISFFLFRPFEMFFSLLVRKTISGDLESRKKRLSQEDFLELLDLASDEGAVEEAEKMLMIKTFEFSRSKVQDIMVPIEKVDGISENASLRAAVQKSRSSRHSRIVVRKHDEEDRIIGVLTIYDILFSSSDISDISSIKFSESTRICRVCIPARFLVLIFISTFFSDEVILIRFVVANTSES